jgi:acyl carrier protein
MAQTRRSESEIRAAVLDYLAEHTSNPALRDEPGDVILQDHGLDSFTTFEFIIGLESRLGMSISDELLDARRCRTLNGIVGLLMDVYAQNGGQ